MINYDNNGDNNKPVSTISQLDDHLRVRVFPLSYNSSSYLLINENFAPFQHQNLFQYYYIRNLLNK